MISCSVIQTEGKKEKKGGEKGQSRHWELRMMDPTFLQMAKHLPANEKQWMNSLACFACTFRLFFTYWTVFIPTHKFPHFYPSNSLLHYAERGEWVAVWWLAAYSFFKVILNNLHNNPKLSIIYINIKKEGKKSDLRKTAWVWHSCKCYFFS